MTSGLSYVGFHLVFLVPATLALAAAAAVRTPPATGQTDASSASRRVTDARGYWAVVAAITLVALCYTTPWDNYLIARGVWSYGEGEVLATVWRAPIEEYAFILLQPVLTALWLTQVPLREGWPEADAASTGLRPVLSRVGGGTAGVLVGVVGWALLGGANTFYLGAILAWAAPVLTLQWTVGPRQLVHQSRAVALGTLVPTIYLWGADRVAIAFGVWTLSERYTTGLTLAGLPIEEAIFFLVTNLFVVQGLVLYRWVMYRWASA